MTAFARNMLLVCLSAGSVVSTGCRASMWGLPIAVTGSALTQADAKQQRERLIGRPLVTADRLLGDRHDELVEKQSGARFVRYAIPSLPRMQNFYVVEVSEDQRIVDLQRWIEMHDGFEDVFKRWRIRRKIENREIAAAQRLAKLDEPFLILTSDRSPNVLRVYDVTNATHLRPRVLAVTVNPDNVCTNVTYFGVAGPWKETSRPAKNGAHPDAVARMSD